MKASNNFYLWALLAACATPPEASAPQAQAVRVVDPQEGPITEGHTVLGELAPARSVRVLAQVAGTAAAFEAPEGGHVERGAVVVRITAPDVAARLDRMAAERGRAEHERGFLCAQLETDRVLADAGDVSPVQLAQSERACASATQASEAALAAEREAGVVGARAVERAPFDGVVLSHLVDPGQVVMPGTPLLLLGSEEQVLRVRIPQEAAQRVSPGGRAETGLGPGRVQEVGAQATGPARLVEVLVALDAPSVTALPGTAWPVTLVATERAQAIAVPEEALGTDAEGPFVYVVQADRLQRFAVTPGPREAGWVAVEPAPPGPVVASAVSGLDPARPVLAVRR